MLLFVLLFYLCCMIDSQLYPLIDIDAEFKASNFVNSLIAHREILNSNYSEAMLKIAFRNPSYADKQINQPYFNN